MVSEPMNIRMVDTLGQYSAIQEEVDTAVQAVIRSGMYINGPVVNRFAEQLGAYLDDTHVIPCANGTDALQIALMALDLKPGDEVIVPSFTFVATVEVLALLQLKPVFVEVDMLTFNLDPTHLSKALSPKTKAILPVHLYGHVAEMAPILQFAEAHGLYVIEDAAQAIGGSYRFPDGRTMKAGTMGTIGCTSFYPSKNLGAYGDGGAIFTRDAALADRLKTICQHGSHQRYLHEIVGVNSRLDAIQAAILEIKLRRLDQYNEARRSAARQYTELLSDIEGLICPSEASYAHHVFHQYTLRLTAGRETRDKVKAFMDEAGIPSMIYYPIPCHLQEAYRHYGYQMGDLPGTEQLTAEVISLPMHSELTREQIIYISSHLKKALS